MHPNTARISNVDSIMFVIRLKEMVSFEFSMEIEKDDFCLVTSMEQKEKILSPHEELNIRPLDSWVTKNLILVTILFKCQIEM